MSSARAKTRVEWKRQRGDSRLPGPADEARGSGFRALSRIKARTEGPQPREEGRPKALLGFEAQLDLVATLHQEDVRLVAQPSQEALRLGRSRDRDLVLLVVGDPRVQLLVERVEPRLRLGRE